MDFFSADTVPPSESKSRRWKSPNTPSTSAHSAERRPSRDTRWESGTASHATRPSLEAHTPYRTLSRALEYSIFNRGRLPHLPAQLTYLEQNPSSCCYAIDAPTLEGNC